MLQFLLRGFIGQTNDLSILWYLGYDLNEPLPDHLIPILSIIGSLFLIVNLLLVTIGRFIVWLVIGLVIYFAYSQRRSHLQRELTATGSGGGNGGAAGGETTERW